MHAPQSLALAPLPLRTTARPLAHRRARGAKTTALATMIGTMIGTMIATAIATVLVASAPTSLHAQRAAGAGDDAVPVPRGGVRVRIAGQWNDWEETYGDSANGSGRRRLLSALNDRPFGTALLPQLRGTESALRELTGQSSLALSLGTLEARGDVRQSTAPIAIDVGVTRRLAIGVVIPYVESRDNAGVILNRAGTTANVGLNPARTGTNAVAARTANGAVLRQIAAARAQLAAEITRCADVMATDCDAIRANPAAAQELVTRALAAQGAIGAVYGDSVRAGAPVVPFGGTSMGNSVNAAVTALRTSFESFGVTALSANTFPAGATIAYGPGSLGALAADSAFGLGYRRIGNTRRSGVGDIDLVASFLLFDSFGANQRRRLTNTGRGVRALVAGGWRFGSAGADDPLDPFDVPIGDGTNALLARATGDLVLGSRFWVSGTVRATKPFEDELTTATPLRTDTTYFSAFTLARARRTLGTRLEFEAAPRYSFGDFFALSGAYLMRRSGSDRLAMIEPSPSSEPGIFEISTPTRVQQAASVGVTFSTLASYVRNRSRFPVEVIYTHTFPITGSGGAPVVSTDRLELRVYTGFPRN